MKGLSLSLSEKCPRLTIIVIYNSIIVVELEMVLAPVCANWYRATLGVVLVVLRFPDNKARVRYPLWQHETFCCFLLLSVAFCYSLYLGVSSRQHHKWYLDKFRDEYPSTRRAFIPLVW